MKDHNQKKRIKPVEARYLRALNQLRSLHVSQETKDMQKNLMWIKKEIEDYGMVFFANLFVYPLVIEFEKGVQEIANHPSTKHSR